MLKKVFSFQLVVFAIAFLVIVFAKSDLYAADCDVASVEKVGPYYGKVVVTLMNKTSSSVGGTWAPNTTRQFHLDNSILNQGLATLLTAYSMNKTVWARIESTTAQANSLITIIYINK